MVTKLKWEARGFLRELQELTRKAFSDTNESLMSSVIELTLSLKPNLINLKGFSLPETMLFLPGSLIRITGLA